MHTPASASAGRARRGLLSRRRRLAPLAAFAVAATFTAGAASARATPPAPAPADPAVIAQWNQLAVSALLADTTKAQPGNIFLMGMLHATVYDAVVGVEGRFQPYAFKGRAPRGTSSQASAVAAAHRFLVNYVPAATATLDTAYTAALAAIPDGTAKDNGVAFGTRVADDTIARRADDGRNAPVTFSPTPGPGVWEPTPPAFAPMTDPWLAFVRPLMVRSAKQFGPPPPPALTSAQYTRDYNEVKELGSKTSTVRTPEQTANAMFYSGSLLVQWNATLRDQIAVRKLDIVEAARTAAAVDMNVADAYATVWRAKFDYAFWRPITAINRGDTDGNPDTVADPTWVPLIATPSYPEYSSGYNVMTAAVTGTLEKLFGSKNLNVTLISTAVPDVRHYDSGKAIRADVLIARIELGIHFRTADEESRDLGLRLVDWTMDRFFQPVRSRY